MTNKTYSLEELKEMQKEGWSAGSGDYRYIGRAKDILGQLIEQETKLRELVKEWRGESDRSFNSAQELSNYDPERHDFMCYSIRMGECANQLEQLLENNNEQDK